MGLADRDYTKGDYGGDSAKREYALNANTEHTQEVENVTQQSSLFCGYCGKEIEVEFNEKDVMKTIVKNGVVTYHRVKEIIKESKSAICSTCRGTFCLDCIESYYKDKDRFVVTNICKRCKEKADEEKKKDCTHKYVKRFIRNDKYFDYYEKECLYCGDKKGIAEPIKKIKKETEPKPVQKRPPKTTPKTQKKGISKVIESLKNLLK
jgi:hypothetical protein